MDPGRGNGEGLEGLDPGGVHESAAMVSGIQRERAIERRRKLEQRRSATRQKAQDKRYLELERVKCGKKACKKCASGELHGPYWYLYRPKETGSGRTSEYIGKVLPETLAEEFDIPDDQRTAN